MGSEADRPPGRLEVGAPPIGRLTIPWPAATLLARRFRPPGGKIRARGWLASWTRDFLRKPSRWSLIFLLEGDRAQAYAALVGPEHVRSFFHSGLTAPYDTAAHATRVGKRQSRWYSMLPAALLYALLRDSEIRRARSSFCFARCRGSLLANAHGRPRLSHRVSAAKPTLMRSR
jgi:hypothetical protein